MYLGIDLGTGSVKLMLVDKNGNIDTASATYPIEAPQSGFAETDPKEWITSIKKALYQLAKKSELSKIQSIGFSGQMHGIVLLDENDELIGRAILWADQRGGKYLNQLQNLNANLKTRLLNAPASGMCASTLLWLKHEAPEIYAKIKSVLFPKDYIRFIMTGQKATDYSDASGSLLYDFKEREWYQDVIDALGLKQSYLPTIQSSLKQAGVVTKAGALTFDLSEGILVATGGGDALVGMFGSYLHTPNQIQISVGTAAQISRPIAADRLPEWNPSLNVFEGIRKDDRYQVAAMLNAGIALEWVCRILKRDWQEIYAELDQRDLTEKPDLLFLPYLGGERTPYMNPNARGAWIGLGLHHTDMDMAYAALIGVACTIRMGLETLGTKGVDSVRAVGGSLRYEFWRNLLASIIGQSITISEQTDISAYGAVRIAAEMLGKTDINQGLLTQFPSKTYHGVALPWIDSYFDQFKKSYQLLTQLST